jgi:hypothetical protein
MGSGRPSAGSDEGAFNARALVVFHPEITTSTVGGWLDLGGREQCLREGVDPDGLLARSRAMEQRARANARHLVDAFLDRVAGATD